MNPKEVVNTIMESFDRNGARHYGEDVTELEHALQSATFAQRAGEPDSLVASCLLHDYGHLLHDLGEDIAEKNIDAKHEDLTGDALAPHFDAEVSEPARLHVAAKRYLCGTDRTYLDGLSDASRRSLELQGGPMNAEEIAAFEKLPHYEAAVRLRHYDDMGKIAGMETASLESFRPLLESLVRA